MINWITFSSIYCNALQVLRPKVQTKFPNGPKVALFGFSRDESLKRKWIHEIQRANFFPSQTSKVSNFD